MPHKRKPVDNAGDVYASVDKKTKKGNVLFKFKTTFMYNTLVGTCQKRYVKPEIYIMFVITQRVLQRNIFFICFNITGYKCRP